VKCNAVKPGKGGAFNQVELKNILDGRKLNERFRAAETVERVRLDQKPHTFLYAEGEMLVFMNSENYEQINLQSEFVGDQAVYLTDGMAVDVEFYEERAISKDRQRRTHSSPRRCPTVYAPTYRPLSAQERSLSF